VPIEGRGKKVQGTLVGLRDGERVALQVDGDEVEIPLGEIERGNLVFRWERGQKR
jgi:ribosome maturation factor RimP